MTLRSPLGDSLKYKILPQILTNESFILWLDIFKLKFFLIKVKYRYNNILTIGKMMPT